MALHLDANREVGVRRCSLRWSCALFIVELCRRRYVVSAVEGGRD